MTIDWTKPILWDGKPARVLATDMAGECCYLIHTLHDDELYRCAADGAKYADKTRVTNAPKRVERWANAYADDYVSETYSNREVADCYKRYNRITALVRYTFEGDKLVDVAIVPLEPAP